jgi:cytochrome P450 family 6
MMLLIQLIGVALALFYFFVKRKLSYWERLGVPHIKPDFFWGNTKGIDSKYHHSEFWRQMYLKLKNAGPIAGVYVYTEPVAMVTDLDLAKRVFVKDFDYFCNRGGYLNEKDDPGTAHIVNLEDDTWRTMRNRISPFFVTGKLKSYFPRIAELADIFTDRIDLEDDLEIRELVSRLVVDVLGRVLFSREFNQLKELKTDISEIVCQTQRDITFTSKTLGGELEASKNLSFC